jgi:hypothetical protein
MAMIQFFANADYADKYKRSYPKLQSVVANIGGVLKFIFFISRMFTVYISSQMMYMDLSNYIIDHDGEAGKIKRPVIQQGAIKVDNYIDNSNHMKSNDLSSHYMEMTKNINPRPRTLKSLTCLEAMLPSCGKGGKSKAFLSKSAKVIEKYMSLNFIIKKLSEFERFKQVIFNDKQQTLFKYVRYPTLIEHTNNFNDDKKLDKLTDDFVGVNDHDEKTRKLVKMID